MQVHRDMKGAHAMIRQPTPKPEPRKDAPPEPGVQQGGARSRTDDDRLKRIVKQHPQRDEPKVDSVEPGDTPPR
jgi:hypothetical protein